MREIWRRLGAFADGVTAYRGHPFHRDSQNHNAPWQCGTSRLLDGRLPGQNPDAPTALLIPSLVNRAFILDATRRYSVMRGLVRRGVHPFLLDWDAPGPAEADFSIGDYVIRRIEPAMAEIRRLTGKTPILIGYCMGGLLALAAAIRNADLVPGLVLMATPWDFHASQLSLRTVLGGLMDGVRELVRQEGCLSVDMLQTLFAAIDPELVPRKYSAFPELPRRGVKSREFVLIEDWVNDGVPLAPNVALECLEDWYMGNLPARGEWRVGGSAIRPADVTCPTLLVIPERDRIVPPASALALAEALPGAKVLPVQGGHVSMLISHHVGTELHAPIAKAIRGWCAAQ